MNPRRKFFSRKIDISVVIPTYNEEGNIENLISRLSQTFSVNNINYELIFIDDHSTDSTVDKISQFLSIYPIKVFFKKGQKGKAQSILEGARYAKSEILAMIDADLQYPPESIPSMLAKIDSGADVIVGNRSHSKISFLRKLTHSGFLFVFGRLLHGFNCDVQSGLKVFKKEVIQRVTLNPTAWTFDLEFLVKAKHGGYKIETVNINFDKRVAGQSKLPIFKSIFEIGIGAIKLKFQSSEIIHFSKNMSRKSGVGFHYKGKRYVTHNKLPISSSAIFTLTYNQRLLLILFSLFILSSFLINWHLTLIVVLGILTFLYFTDILFNFYLIYKSFTKNPEIKILEQNLSRVKRWPTYTILCPLYKEWEVLPQFVKGIESLDYPKENLQVLLLLEEDDKVTIEKVNKMKLPIFFQVLTVPHSTPKTKPKACNYGLKFTKGEYVVIYDAEDLPEADQLKKAVVAFQNLPTNIFCLQAKLNFYNPNQNLLTKLFTSEYSLWFDLILTGLQSINTTIPLGGTSNHFKTKDLLKLHGWDAFNVTEDCDLGIRLVKLGYQTAVLDSTTHEEANSKPLNWFWQRTRWIKGYIQTYLVHMRNPNEFRRDNQKMHLWAFQLVVGGKVLSTFINPLMWSITISYFAFRSQLGPLVESFYPTPVLYMGVFSLVFGNFLYLYYYMIGLTKRGYFELIKYSYFVPFYWLAMSLASWIALYKLIIQPHHWSKTLHGLHLEQKITSKKAEEIIAKDFTKQPNYSV